MIIQISGSNLGWICLVDPLPHGFYFFSSNTFSITIQTRRNVVLYFVCGVLEIAFFSVFNPGYHTFIINPPSPHVDCCPCLLLFMIPLPMLPLHQLLSPFPLNRSLASCPWDPLERSFQHMLPFELNSKSFSCALFPHNILRWQEVLALYFSSRYIILTYMLPWLATTAS